MKMITEGNDTVGVFFFVCIREESLDLLWELVIVIDDGGWILYIALAIGKFK